MELSDVHAELITLFENTLSAGLDEVIKFYGEFCHSVSQVVEPKVDAWEGVGH